MKKIIILILFKIIYNETYSEDNSTYYWLCDLEFGCEYQTIALIGCNRELYSFKLNTTKCEEINGIIDYYFCDNYIEENQEFTVEACSPSKLR